MRILIGLLKIVALLLTLVAVAGVAAILTVYHMTGKESVEVPELVGREMRDAFAVVDERGLRIHIEEDDGNTFSDTVPTGYVLRQLPSPGGFLKQDRRVRVWLSSGPREVYVPPVVGQPVRVAQMRIHEAGLRLGEVVYVTSDLVPDGVVIDQEPTRLGGTDSRVSLLVSSGATSPGFVMPDLLGKHALRAQGFLELNAFRVRVETEVYDGVPSGTVVRQKPLAGYMARAGDTIWLWQSRPGGGAFGP